MIIPTELSNLHQVIDQLPESAIPKLARNLRALLVEMRHKKISPEERAEREEFRAWLNISEPSYSFWDNEKDAAYDSL